MKHKRLIFFSCNLIGEENCNGLAVVSVRENWGMEILLSFLVDPQWEEPRKKGHGVWAIMASLESPDYFDRAEGEIAVLSLSGGKFDQKLAEFILQIITFRRECSEHN